jgi:hypothetical protein
VMLTLSGRSVTRNRVTASASIGSAGGGPLTAFPVTLSGSAIAGNATDDCVWC